MIKSGDGDAGADGGILLLCETCLKERKDRIAKEKAEKKLLPIQPGDVAETFADITESERDLGFQPSIGIEEGIEYFVAWYRSYYGKSQNLFSTPFFHKHSE